MLLLLTGDVQIGKTTWLMNTAQKLIESGIGCDGVIAPGVWKELPDGTFDKLGIDNYLLPDKKCIPFGRRLDLAVAEGTFHAESQAGKAQMKWHISDDAIDIVNNHFDALMAHNESYAEYDTPLHKIVFIDELGQLELLRGGGLTSAMKLLELGPMNIYEHAVIVARDKFGLPDRAEELFAETWGGCVRITHNQETFDTWFKPLVDSLFQLRQ